MTGRRTTTVVTLLTTLALALAHGASAAEPDGIDPGDVFTVIDAVATWTTEDSFGAGPLASTDARTRFTDVTNAAGVPGRLAVAGAPVVEHEGLLTPDEVDLGDDDTTGELGRFTTFRLRAHDGACQDGAHSTVLLDEAGPVADLAKVAGTLEPVLAPGAGLCVRLDLIVDDATNIAQGDTLQLGLRYGLVPVAGPGDAGAAAGPTGGDVHDARVGEPTASDVVLAAPVGGGSSGPSALGRTGIRAIGLASGGLGLLALGSGLVRRRGGA